MKLLADEDVDRLIVEWVRVMGHDVRWVAEQMPGTPDPKVLRIAEADPRVVLTNDLDFGELVIRQRLPAIGVILLRFTVASEAERLARLQSSWHRIEPFATGPFVTVTDKRVRLRPLNLP